MSPAPQTVDPLAVLTLANQGRTALQIAETLDCDRSYVYKLARDIGVQLVRGPGPNRTPDKVRARIKDLRSHGWTYAAIAHEVGLSRSAVAMILGGKR